MRTVNRNRLRPRNKYVQRRGYTVIEMILNVGFCALLLALAAQVLVQVFGVHRTMVEHTGELRTLELLRDSLQRDLRSASEFAVRDGELVVTDRKGGVVTYSSEETENKQSTECSRQAEGLLPREWILPVESRVTFSRREDDLVQCRIDGWSQYPVIWQFAVRSSAEESTAEGEEDEQ